MAISIREVNSLPSSTLQHLYASFDVTAVVSRPYHESLSMDTTSPSSSTPQTSRTRLKTDPVPRYRKSYPTPDTSTFSKSSVVVSSAEGALSQAHHDDPRVILVAVDENDGDRIRGYLLASKGWNGVVHLEDIAIDRTYRRSGIGRLMMDSLKDWTRGHSVELGRVAIRAETQDNNVEACRFYMRCGFKFGGYDEYLYSGVEDERNRQETALFWYWFDEG